MEVCEVIKTGYEIPILQNNSKGKFRMAMKLEIGKIYKTKIGDQVCIDALENDVFLGRLYDFNGKEYKGKWRIDREFALASSPESKESHSVVSDWDWNKI